MNTYRRHWTTSNGDDTNGIKYRTMLQYETFIHTHKDLCQACYTCVRSCPAKAIKITQGLAEVAPERCIHCGRCTKVCNLGAKQYERYTERVRNLLAEEKKVVAIVDSAFPAEFDRFNEAVLTGMIRTLGFDYILDSAIGADLVIAKYKKRYFDTSLPPTICANCPSIVNYVEKYHPKLVPFIAPIVSPMIATARIAKHTYGKDIKIVYIGPCIAKKAKNQEVDISITFKELREMFSAAKILSTKVALSNFDAPIGRNGGISVVRRGVLKAMGIEDNLLIQNVISANGRVDFREAIKEFEHGALKSYHLSLLSCKGCIMGPGMSTHKKQFGRTLLVSEYVKKKVSSFSKEAWEQQQKSLENIDLKQTFKLDDKRIPLPPISKIKAILAKMGKKSSKDFLNCGACGYDTCIEHTIAMNSGLAEEEMCLHFAIAELHKSVKNLAVTNKDLASVKEALKQSEKLASMGQLSAGIAHELNNPLGVVIMYSNILLEEVENDNEMKEDLNMIVQQAERCKNIVGGLLNFARKNRVQLHEVSIVELVENSIHSLIVPTNIEIEINSNVKDPFAMLDAEQITQVLNNLVKNAIEAMMEGGLLSIEISDTPKTVEFSVCDSGHGISPDKLDKIFEPFYTTKEIGKGTGLGLATSYGIVKMHNGTIKVKSNNKEEVGKVGTSFFVKLPRHK